jgi:hypothetical protein
LTGRGWRRWLPAALDRGGDAMPQDRRLVFLHLPRTGGMALQQHLESLVGRANVVRIPLPPDVFEHLAEVRSKQMVLGHFFYPAVRLVPGEPTLATVLRDPVARSISTWEYLQWRTTHPDHELLVSRGIKSLEDFVEDPYLSGHIRNNQTRLLGAEFDIEGMVASLQTGESDLAEARRLTAQAKQRRADDEMLERAKRRLDGMSVVGVTEELPEFVRVLERVLGLPPAPPLKPHNATPPATVALRESAYDEGIRDRLAHLNRFDVELYAFARGLWESRGDPVAAAG